jgi:hypothetical protein
VVEGTGSRLGLDGFFIDPAYPPLLERTGAISRNHASLASAVGRR